MSLRPKLLCVKYVLIYLADKAEELKDFLWSLEKIENENLDTGIAEKFITDLQKREEFKSNPQGYEFEFMLDYHYCRPR